MKKLLTLVCFFLCIPVYALEYSPVPCENLNDTVNVERRYQFYQNMTRSFYFREGENTKEYPHINRENVKMTSFSPWSYEKPKPYTNRRIEERKVYMYKEINPIQYLYLFSLSGTDEKLIFMEIELYNNNQKIPFEIKCDTCSPDFSKKVTDGDNRVGGYARKDSLIEIHFAPQKYQNLNLYLSLHDEGSTVKKIEARATYERNVEDVYYDYASQHYFTHDGLDEIETVTIPINRMRKISPKFGEEKISLEPLSASEERKVEERVQYRYQDMLFKYVGSYRQYLEGYRKEADALKDETFYQDYFLCVSKEIFKEKEFLKPQKDLLVYTTTNFLPKIKIRQKEKSCPSSREGELLECQKKQRKTFFWVFLFLLFIVLYEIYKKHFHKN